MCFVQLHNVAVSPVMKPIDDTFQYPYNELLLWAVLTKRHQMALFFWERGKLMGDYSNSFLSICLSLGEEAMAKGKI